MLFELAGKAGLRAISITRGGGDDGEVVAVLGLTFDGQGPEPVAAALGAESVDDLAMFHDTNPDRDRKFLRLDSLAIGSSYAGKHKLTIAGFDVRTRKVAKITAAPVGLGQWSVSCSVQVTNPPANMLEVLAEMLHSEVRASLAMDPELPLEGGGRAADAARNLGAMARADGAVAELVDADGNMIARFGDGAPLYDPQKESADA